MSLSKGITYFEMQGRNINLDGVVGYIILQGKPLGLCYSLNLFKIRYPAVFVCLSTIFNF